MKRLVVKGLLLSAALVAAPVIRPVVHEIEGLAHIDPRLPLLTQFFESNKAPVVRYSRDFLAAADRNDLDWRLLPSIALVESGGGRAYRNNNIFGWDNCNQRFQSVRHGIYQVASRLANSKLYRDKETDEILRTYNPNADYSTRVLRVMRSISPAETPVLLDN